MSTLHLRHLTAIPVGVAVVALAGGAEWSVPIALTLVAVGYLGLYLDAISGGDDASPR